MIEQTNIPNITIEKLPKRSPMSVQVWVVRRNGQQIGLIERFTFRKGEEHPYKALLGHGEKMLGAFYPSEMPSKRGIEAKSKALVAIVNA